jgi:hypothetical protein
VWNDGINQVVEVASAVGILILQEIDDLGASGQWLSQRLDFAAAKL